MTRSQTRSKVIYLIVINLLLLVYINRINTLQLLNGCMQKQRYRIAVWLRTMSALSLNRLKSVDDRSRLIVNAYIRDVFNEIDSITHIPTEIIDLCIIFFFIGFQWDTESKCPRLTANNQTLTVTFKDGNGGKPSNIYSSTLIHQRAVNVLKIQTIVHKYSIFGIVESNCKANDKPIVDTTWAMKENNAFAFGGCYGYKYKSDGVYHEYGEKPNDNDIVTMKVDMINGTISYSINEKDFGIAWKDIDIEEEYKFAASMYHKNEQFQVVDYYTENPK